MTRPTFTRSRVGRLTPIFGGDKDADLKRHVARLSVLFEDLRIEIAGVAADDLSGLDEAGRRMRQRYFLRRSFATLFGFAETLEELDQCPGFVGIKERIDPLHQSLWTEAVKYFSQNRPSIERVRSNVGGHFGKGAAKLAVRNIGSEDIGSIELAWYSHGGGGANLFFASTIVGIALIHSMLGSGAMEQKVERLFQLAQEAQLHAVRAVDCITVAYLWDRFGRN